MGRISVKKRRMKISQHNQRQRKLAILRAKYTKMTGTSEKNNLWQKVKKIAPWLERSVFEQPIKAEKK